MSGRRKSGRGMSMSQTAKKILKAKRRREKLGLAEKETEASPKALWILAVVGLIVAGLIIAGILSGGR